jgi:hypothetical protein
MTFKSVVPKPLCSRLFPSDLGIPIRAKLGAAQGGVVNNANGNANNNAGGNANAHWQQQHQQHPQPVQLAAQSPSIRNISNRGNVLPMRALWISPVLLLLTIIGQIPTGTDGLTCYETDEQVRTAEISHYY